MDEIIPYYLNREDIRVCPLLDRLGYCVLRTDSINIFISIVSSIVSILFLPIFRKDGVLWTDRHNRHTLYR